jgi:adenylate cyclase
MQGKDETDLIDWLLHQGRDSDDLGAVFAGACARLLSAGLPLWRASLAIPAIDPTLRALSFVWWRDRGLSTERVAADAATAAVFQRSPIFYLSERNQPAARWNLEEPETARQFTLFEELRQLGATEYALRLVSFSERRTALTGVALSMATDRPGGFVDADMETAARLLPALAVVAYRIGLLQVATDTLGAYLGPTTGRHVLEGMIRRGDSQTLSVALLLADLRGFTALADRADGAAVVAWLNEHLEAIGDPVAECGGEILKFMGDGLLAVFPVGEFDPATACRNALAAASEALARTAALNALRTASGGPELDLSLVLHFGDVVYGNIGTARRLDFTVIGPAVNEASRMEALGKAIGQPLLLSETFARHCNRRTSSLGPHSLRGIAGEREIFVLEAGIQ